MVSATAVCHGAATIVNAIATGKGAAFGLGLEAKATVELKEGASTITSLDIKEPRLVETCVKNVLSLFKYKYGATIRVESDIPIARGLKSSSVVANAAVLATFGALAKVHGGIKMVRIDKELSRQQLNIGGDAVTDEMVLDISVKSAKEAGVTITGALDDAAAAYFGGFVVTDNAKNKIARRGEMEDLHAVIFVPEKKQYTKDVDVEAMKVFSREADAVWNLALQGDLYTAMTLNGLVYSAATGQQSGVAEAAMNAGALAAGLSGTGPAVVAITKKDPDKILDSWAGFEGQCIQTKVSNEKARVIQ
jgi:shikimate kinase